MFFPNFIKKVKEISPKEPLLLFLVFFLPGFLSQTGSIDPEIFNSLFFNLYYMVTVLPQILLLLYLIDRKGKGSFKRYGITRLRGNDLLRAFLYFAIVMVIMVAIGIMISFFSEMADYDYLASLPGWKIKDLRILPILILTCLTTGYSEELFFRSYLLTEFVTRKEDKIPVSTGISLLFATGHIYQGPGGFLSTFAIGLFFSHVFLKNKRIHSIAIGHSLYNFAVLLLSLFIR